MPASFDRALIIPLLVPYGTSVPIERKPWATYGLMVITFVTFVIGAGVGSAFFRNFALHSGGSVFQYLTYAFVHEAHTIGILHFAHSMLLLWLFGSALESKIQWWGILVLYLLSAVAGGLSHAVLQDSPPPLVGASGAVFGLMGAFLVLYPYAMVRCFFILIARPVSLMALYFIALYWLVLATVPLLQALLSWNLQLDSISQPAHLGGFFAGAALAVARFGSYGFSAQADEDAVAERRLERKLGRAVQSEPNDTSDSNIFPMDKVHRAEFVSKPMRPVHEHLIMGDKQGARDEFAKLIPFDARACLPPPSQLDLARMLEEIGDDELAIEAFDRLLRAFPTHAVTHTAKLELARLLIRLKLRSSDVDRLLHEFLATNPPGELEREAYRLLRQAEGRIGIQVGAESTIFGSLVQQEPEKPFGDPEDTDVGFVSVAAVPQRSVERAEPQPEYNAEPTLRLPYQNPEPQRPLDEHETSDPAIHIDLNQAGDIELSSSIAGKAKPSTPGPTPAAPPEPIGQPPEPLHSRLAGMPSDEDYTQGLADSGHNRRVAELHHNDFGRAKDHSSHFALILPPSMPVDVRAIVHVLAPEMGMKKNAAHHALLRRRGVLTDHLRLEHAERLARDFAARGQGVAIVAKGPGWTFRAPQDVLSMQLDARSANCGMEGGNLIRIAWEDVVCVGAGMVHLSPDSPPRALIDLFVAQAGHHLRIWENSFAFGPAASSQHRFVELAHALADLAPHAILTRAMQTWLNANEPHPAADFASLIEYENALEWHLLAYFAPRMEVAPQTS